MSTDQKTIDELRARARADVAGLPPLDVPAVAKKPPVAHCNSCGAAIWWGETAKGKRCPYNYDLVTATATKESHFATCPHARDWSKRK